MARQREVSIAFQTDKRAAVYVALARLVDGYTFDVVSVYCDAPYHPSYGPLMLMAPHIQRARLIPAAISPSRIHPIDIAAQTALLHDLAPGRVGIGLARGAWLAEHGITEQRPAVQAIREAAEIVSYLLKGSQGGYHGQVFTLAEHVNAPYPLPEGEIPILIGSWGPKLCAVAGELADEVKVGGSANPDVVPVIQQYIMQGERQAGREPESVGVVIGAVTVVDEDRDAARERARQAVALYLPVVAGLDLTVSVDPELMQRVAHHVNIGEPGEAARLISDDLLERFAFAGSTDDIIRQSEALFAAGASRVEFGTPHGLVKPEVGIRLLGERVLPALQNSLR